MVDRRTIAERATWRKLQIGLGVLVAASIAGVGGFMIAGWSLVDAVYMVVITIYGVGFGEVQPIESPELKAFTTGLVLVGCTAAIYSLGAAAQMIAEGELTRLMGNRRMTRVISELENHTILCGFGRVGQLLAADLAEATLPFVVVDTDRQRITLAEERGYLVVIGDATDEETLTDAGIKAAAHLVTALPDDAINVFITLTARELASRIHIVARAEMPSTRNKLRRSGADEVVSPAEIGAARMARLLLLPSAEQLVESQTERGRLQEELQQFGLTLGEILVPETAGCIGKPLAAVDFGSDALVVGVRAKGQSTELNPDSDRLLAASDTIVVLAHQKHLPRLAHQIGEAESPQRTRYFKNPRIPDAT